MNTSQFWKHTRVAVTGAGGFIGQHMVTYLLAQGAIVTGLVSQRQKNVTDKSNDPHCAYVAVDLTDKNATMDALRDSDALFHFAGLDGGASYKNAHTHDILQTNSRITLNILNACRENHIQRLLLMSSIEVYPKNLVGIVNESSGEGNWFYEDVSGYAWVKRYTEILAKFYHDNVSRIAIARVGNVYGPGDDALKGRVMPTFIEQAKHNKPIHITSPKDMKLSFMYVSDLVRALALVLEHYAVCEPINILSSQQIGLYELAKKIVSITHSKSSIIFTPATTKVSHVEHSNKKFLQLTGFQEEYSLDEGIRTMKDGI